MFTKRKQYNGARDNFLMFTLLFGIITTGDILFHCMFIAIAIVLSSFQMTVESNRAIALVLCLQGFFLLVEANFTTFSANPEQKQNQNHASK